MEIARPDFDALDRLLGNDPRSQPGGDLRLVLVSFGRPAAVLFVLMVTEVIPLAGDRLPNGVGPRNWLRAA